MGSFDLLKDEPVGFPIEMESIAEMVTMVY